ncbi:aldo/keto reductase [Tropicimonas sp. IMCC6043]|uniref:aldo/keto reductase n=1 Tax=Tropicimonas sp. IMCC6043 TaxID=2510645 RepID=UPI00101C1ECC|nr:aldo/keto reductase [Tropicimonas sp. IMCC6043]RYH09793.1 aldo/keto reductase [Tropicimonas sp. IMCC6043]
MHERRMGADGTMVSAIGVGAMSFTDFYGPTEDSASMALLDAAFEAGVTHLDTSNVYGAGRSERVIGAFLKARGAVTRDRLHIATKAGITRDPDTGARRFDNSPGHLTAELEGSLKRLGVEAVDLFYVHRREAARPIEEVTETLAGLVKAGKTRAIGFSEIAPASLRRAAAIHPIAAVQSEYSLWTRAPELGLVQTCAALGTTLVAFSPVGRSMLTDHPIPKERFAECDLIPQNPRFQEPNWSANMKIADGFRAFAAEMGVPAAGLAIAWLLAQGDHVVPIPGTRSLTHFAELVTGTRVALNPEDLAKIERILPVGWAHGDRYSDAQWFGPERYC